MSGSGRQNGPIRFRGPYLGSLMALVAAIVNRGVWVNVGNTLCDWFARRYGVEVWVPTKSFQFSIALKEHGTPLFFLFSFFWGGPDFLT